MPPNLEAQQAMLHLFLKGLRWKLENQARLTTWLEIFAVFRLLGGGGRGVVEALGGKRVM